MGDPVTWGMVIGAGVGAMADDEKPLRGATLGAMTGGAGGAAMGGATAASGTAGAYGALPGMAAPSMQTSMLASQAGGLGAAAIPAATQGSQAAMLATQTGSFGPSGLLATGQAAATPGSITSGAFGVGKNMAWGGQDASKIMKAGQGISAMGKEPPQQQQRPAPIIAPPMQRQNAGGRIRSPYEEPQQGFTYGQQSLLPGFGRY